MPNDLNTELEEQKETDENESGTETSTTSGTKNSPEDSQRQETDEQNETDEFDPAVYEESFGLTPGSLKGVETAADALKQIRAAVDKDLAAGVGYGGEEFTGGINPPEKKQAYQKIYDKATDPKPSGNADYDALRAELTEVKTKLEDREKADQEHRMAEIDRRIAVEIDSWKSDRYGVGKGRTFTQIKAANGIVDLLRTQVIGAQKQGKAVNIETMLRQVRAFDDDTYDPRRKPKPGNAVGKPGTGGKSDKKGAPRSIHEAYMQNVH